ncbi:MAG: hypothetical protein ACREXT_15990 [Gammaproteobacteria bacterium]
MRKVPAELPNVTHSKMAALAMQGIFPRVSIELKRGFGFIMSRLPFMHYSLSSHNNRSRPWAFSQPGRTCRKLEEGERALTDQTNVVGTDRIALAYVTTSAQICSTGVNTRSAALARAMVPS